MNVHVKRILTSRGYTITTNFTTRVYVVNTNKDDLGLSSVLSALKTNSYTIVSETSGTIVARSASNDTITVIVK